MWEAARLDQGYQSVALKVKRKTDEEVYKTLWKAAIKESLGLGIERMLVIEKGKTMILLTDQTRVKGGCYKVKKDELKAAWPALSPGDMVRGQRPQTKEWSLKGQVLEMVHGNRAVNVDLDDGRTRLFARDNVRKDTTRLSFRRRKSSSSHSWLGRGWS